MNIKIPEGLEVPESGQIDLVTTFEVRGGELYPLAVDGIPVEGGEGEEAPPEMAAEGEGAEAQGGAEQEMEQAPAAPAAGPDSFMSAIEKAMAKKPTK